MENNLIKLSRTKGVQPSHTKFLLRGTHWTVCSSNILDYEIDVISRRTVFPKQGRAYRGFYSVLDSLWWISKEGFCSMLGIWEFFTQTLCKPVLRLMHLTCVMNFSSLIISSVTVERYISHSYKLAFLACFSILTIRGALGAFQERICCHMFSCLHVKNPTFNFDKVTTMTFPRSPGWGVLAPGRLISGN